MRPEAEDRVESLLPVEELAATHAQFELGPCGLGRQLPQPLPVELASSPRRCGAHGARRPQPLRLRRIDLLLRPVGRNHAAVVHGVAVDRLDGTAAPSGKLPL